MTIAEGTWGTVPWSISDAGALTIGGGVQNFSWEFDYPWLEYADSITSVSITGDISQHFGIFGDALDGTQWDYAFENLKNLVSVSGLSHLKRATDLTRLFYGCSSLSSLDLSGLDTSETTDWWGMLGKCDTLTTVTFGAYSISKLSSGWNRLYFINPPNYRTAEKNGLVVSSDDQFLSLTDSERAGTWTRKPTATQIKCTAYRTDSGSESDDGADATFKFTYALMGTDTAPVRIFQKAASESSYPSTPVATTGLPAPSGTTTYTIKNIGDGTYDFRIEVVDDGKTYVFFPEISSNVHLVDITRDGNVTVYGGADIRQGLDVDGACDVGGALSVGRTVTANGEMRYKDYDRMYSSSNNKATAVPSANWGVTHHWEYDKYNNRVGYAEIQRTPTGVYRSFGVENPKSGAADRTVLYLNANDNGTRSVSLTSGVAWEIKNGGTGATSAANARKNLGAVGATKSGNDWALLAPDGDDDAWFLTTTKGICPRAGGGSGSLGTASWPFNNVYAKNIYHDGTKLGSFATKSSLTVIDVEDESFSGTVSVPANNGANVTITMTAPSGYTFGSLESINTNHQIAVAMTAFARSGTKYTVYLRNLGSSAMSTTVTITVRFLKVSAS